MAEKNILLADPSHAVQKVIFRAFSKLDYELVVAENFSDADDFLRDEKPDLVMADVALPGKNGYELCEYLKSNPGTASIPVILIVGTDHTIDREESSRVHADEYILRPFDSKGLLDKVGALLHEPSSDQGDNALLSDMGLSNSDQIVPETKGPEAFSEMEPLELLDVEELPEESSPEESLPEESLLESSRLEMIPPADFIRTSTDTDAEPPSILTDQGSKEEASIMPPLAVDKGLKTEEDIILSQMGLGGKKEDDTASDSGVDNLLIGSRMDTAEILPDILSTEAMPEEAAPAESVSSVEALSEDSPLIFTDTPTTSPADTEGMVSWSTASVAETSPLLDDGFTSSAPVGVPRGEIERLVVNTVMEIVGPTANGLVKEAAIDAVSVIADEAVEESVTKAVSERTALQVTKAAEKAVDGAVIEKAIRVAAEKAVENTVAKAVEAAAERAVSSIAMEAVNLSVKKAVEKIAAEAAEKAAIEAVDKIAIMAVEASASESVDNVVEDIVGKIASYSVHRAADDFAKKEAPAAVAKAAEGAVRAEAKEAITHIAAEVVQKTAKTAVDKAAVDAVMKKVPAALKKAATAEIKTRAADTVKKTAGGLISAAAEKSVEGLVQAAVDKAASRVVEAKAMDAVTKAAEDAAKKLTSKTVEKVAGELVREAAEDIVKAELKKAFSK